MFVQMMYSAAVGAVCAAVAIVAGVLWELEWLLASPVRHPTRMSPRAAVHWRCLLSDMGCTPLLLLSLWFLAAAAISFVVGLLRRHPGVNTKGRPQGLMHSTAVCCCLLLASCCSCGGIAVLFIFPLLLQSICCFSLELPVRGWQSSAKARN